MILNNIDENIASINLQTLAVVYTDGHSDFLGEKAVDNFSILIDLHYYIKKIIEVAKRDNLLLTIRWFEDNECFALCDVENKLAYIFFPKENKKYTMYVFNNAHLQTEIENPIITVHKTPYNPLEKPIYTLYRQTDDETYNAWMNLRINDLILIRELQCLRASKLSNDSLLESYQNKLFSQNSKPNKP